MNTKINFLKFFIASLLVCFFAMQNGYAQVAGVDPNNLGAVRVDEMTDAQILDILISNNYSFFKLRNFTIIRFNNWNNP